MIINQIEKYLQINSDIKRTQKSLKEMKKAKKDYEDKIIAFLRSSKQPGVKHKGKIIAMEESKKIKRMKKKEKLEKAEKILNERRYKEDTNETIQEILKAMKGEEIIEYKLSIF